MKDIAVLPQAEAFRVGGRRFRRWVGLSTPPRIGQQRFVGINQSFANDGSRRERPHLEKGG